MSVRTRSTLMQDQKLAALTILVYAELDEPLRIAMKAQAMLPNAEVAKKEHFLGVLLGVCASYLLREEGDEDPASVLGLVAAVSAYINESWGPHSEGDVNKTAERLVPDAFL